MPNDDMDRLLADLDSEDTSEAETSTEVDENRPNRGLKQLRDHAKKLERDLTRTRKEADELKAYKETVEQERKASSLAGAGLNDKQAKAFLRMYENVTPEAISEFRTDVLGQAVEEGSSPPPSFEPTQVVSEPGSRRVTKAEFEGIMRSNPTEGWALLNSGRVEF